MVGGYNVDDMWILREGRGGAGSLGLGGGRKGELVCTDGRGKLEETMRVLNALGQSG